MTKTIEFWFDFASTYSYLSVLRIEPLIAEAGLDLQWRPFLLGPIFAAQGWSNSPFNLYPSRGRAMQRDLERRSAVHGLRFVMPSLFPRNGLLAARLALVGLEEGWAPAFIRAAFSAEFTEDRDIADPDGLRPLIEMAGASAERALERAQSPQIKAALRANTDHAAKRGVFGAPTFIVGDELFWGDDRLQEALLWASNRHPAQDVS